MQSPATYGQPVLARVELLAEFLQQHMVKMNKEDSFTWRMNVDMIFSIKSCYVHFKAKLSEPPLNHNKVMALSHLWKIKFPSKNLFFGWRFTHNRIAIKDLLVRRGILVEGNDFKCVLCLTEE